MKTKFTRDEMWEAYHKVFGNDLKILDLVTRITERYEAELDENDPESALFSALDCEFIWTNDQWDVARFYWVVPEGLSWEEVMDRFISDLFAYAEELREEDEEC